MIARQIADCKRALGDEHMADAELERRLGFEPRVIADARRGRVSSRVAVAVGKVLHAKGLIEHEADCLIECAIARSKGEHHETLRSFAAHLEQLRTIAKRARRLAQASAASS